MSELSAWQERLMAWDAKGGHQGLEEFTELKYFCIGGLELMPSVAQGALT